MEKVEITTTSSQSATCSDIVLREGAQVRLIFRPELVDNHAEPNACVRGRFLYQHKSKKDSWGDFETVHLNTVKIGEGYHLEIRSGELRHLLKELGALYRLHKKEGLPFEKLTLVKADEHLAGLLESSEPELNAYLSNNSADAIKTLRRVLNWLSTSPQSAAQLADDTTQLPNLSALVGLASLRAVAEVWKKNTSNDDEEFWQQVFQKHSFVFSQLFAYPIVIISGKAYVGGKRIDNKHGNIIDFLGRTAMSGEAVLIEIKTPTTELLGGKYRQVFPPSQDLSGAISQVLQYRENFLKDHHSILEDQNTGIVSAEPKCLVIIGCAKQQLIDNERRRAFERFRERLTGVTVVTFDEVFKRVDDLIELFEKNVPSS